jgi:hypothetical protein
MTTRTSAATAMNILRRLSATSASRRSQRKVATRSTPSTRLWVSSPSCSRTIVQREAAVDRQLGDHRGRERGRVDAQVGQQVASLDAADRRPQASTRATNVVGALQQRLLTGIAADQLVADAGEGRFDGLDHGRPRA